MPGPKPEIIFANEHFWLINKPIGWTIQKDEQAPSILLWLNEQEDQTAYPVHRLDKPTSGLLIVAKTPDANRALSMAFAAKQISKTYLAISATKPKKKQGWVKGDMAKSRRGQFKLLRTQDNPASTQFKSVALADGLRGFLLRPKTGKTHQLRVALKSLGSPILGDKLYAGESAERLYLHAYALRFELFEQSYEFQRLPDSAWLAKWPQSEIELINKEKP